MVFERRRYPPVDRLQVRGVYNREYERGGFRATPRLYRWVLDKAPLSRGARLLDIGCGEGHLLRVASDLGLRTWGLELSDVALRRAASNSPDSRLVLAAGEELPFAAESFDCVTNLWNLEHFLDAEQGVREMRRVARAGGWILAFLPNAYYSGDLWRVLRTGYGPDHHQPVERFATAFEWRDLLRSQGLEVVKMWPYNKFKLWKRLLPFHLAYHFLYACVVSSKGTAAGSGGDQ
jgi:SAM-dependent methyltransferase